MGSTESKPLSKEERAIRAVAKSDMAQRRKEEIHTLQKQVLEQQQVGQTAIVEVKEMYTFLHVTEKAKAQLDREGDALVKADLIAISLALEPELINRLTQLQEMRVTDLNSLIRSIVYDPKRLMKKTAQAQPSTDEKYMLR